MPDELDAQRIADRLLPPMAALLALPMLHVSDAELARLRQGLPLAHAGAPAAGEAAAVDSRGQLVAIVAARDGKWRPVRNFS